MRIVFAGTPVFAERALSALAEAGHPIVLTLTRPDQAAGRGQQLQASPVKRRALELGIEVFQPRSLRDAQARQRIAQAEADVMVVAAYGLILPPEVLAIPRHGCLNIHASLLPRWRGAAPIQRAIEAGDERTGVTIMRMNAGLDTGAILLARALEIGPRESAGQLHDRLAALGADAIVAALDELATGRLLARPQPEQGVTYAHKLDKAEAALDWSRPAARLADRIRAFDPFPGSTARLIGPGARPLDLKIWAATPVVPPGSAAPPDTDPAVAPGAIVSVGPEGIVVRCGQGLLTLTELQKPGGRRLPVGAFLQGCAVTRDMRFVRPAPGKDLPATVS